MTIQPKQGHLFIPNHTPIMSVSWSSFPNAPLRSLFTTFTDRIESHLHILQYGIQSDSIVKTASPSIHDLPFTPTAAHFSPKPPVQNDLFMTSGDALRVFSVSQTNDVALISALVDGKYPLPSCGFDWCNQNPEMICTWYLDNSCTIWNVEQKRIQSAQHSQNQIYDLKFCPNSPFIYGIASEKGLLELRDTRKDKSDVLLCQTNDAPDLMKLSWSSADGYT